MVDVPLRGVGKIHSWIWTPNEEHAIQPTDVLVRMYQESVGRNCTFIMGAVIDRDGLVPEPDAKRLGEFGAAITRRYGKPVEETKGEGATVELYLTKPLWINALIAMEDIAHGERVREYQVEGLGNDGEWRKICDGQSIGHKRIQEFPRIKVAVVRIRFTKSIGTPKIRKLAVYDTDATSERKG
jgi:alpha-L-fucosidase